jgi:hypothetical protein
MNRKYVIAGLIGFAAILGWNVFLIQRDERLYDSYYRAQAIENLKKPASSEIGYNPKEKFCQQQAGWHPDCNVE